MKSVYLCLVVFCATIAISGCEGGSEENTLAEGDVTADDIAKYEAELAAVTGDEAHEDDEGDDAE